MAKKAVAKLLYPVAFVADVHLGNFREFGGVTGNDGLNERGRLTVDAWKRALDRAFRAHCTHLFVAGDFFEHRRPEPPIIAASQRVTGDYTKSAISVEIVPGNHDELAATALYGNTACEVLADQANVHRGWEDIAIGSDHGETQFWVRCIPFEATKPMAQFVDEVCTNFKAKEGVRALCTHIGVVDDSSPPFLINAPDAIHADRLFFIMEREGISAAFVGNYHQAKRWERDGRIIQQIGVLNPRGFGDAGLDDVGGLAIWDGVSVKWEQIPGPRFMRVVADRDFGDQRLDLPNGCTLFQRQVEKEQPLVEAPTAQRLASSSDEAVAKWAAEVALPEGVTREELQMKVNALWKAAS